MCVTFFNILSGNKDVIMPNPPSWKKKAIVFTTVIMSAYQDQVKAGFSKVCEICKVHGILFKMCKRFTHWSAIVGTSHKHDVAPN